MADNTSFEKLLATLRNFDEKQINSIGEIISIVAESIRNCYGDAQTEDDAVFLKELSVISTVLQVVDFQKIESQPSMTQATLEELLKYAVKRFGQNSRPVAVLNGLINNFKG